jgi:hypothetical protein
MQLGAVMVWRALHACGDLARQRLSLSQKDASEHERPSPRSGRRVFGRGTGRSYPPANRCLPPSHGQRYLTR